MFHFVYMFSFRNRSKVINVFLTSNKYFRSLRSSYVIPFKRVYYSYCFKDIIHKACNLTIPNLNSKFQWFFPLHLLTIINYSWRIVETFHFSPRTKKKERNKKKNFAWITMKVRRAKYDDKKERKFLYRWWAQRQRGNSDDRIEEVLDSRGHEWKPRGSTRPDKNSSSL